MDIIPNPLGSVGSSQTAQILTAQALKTPYVLSKSSIPFIALSSGSVAANGVISAITALPLAYPSAYCWFPANILATSIAAGWYYCTFSTTSAGIAFLDTYTSGIPTIPANPTAVSDGKGAFTGATTELAGPTITVPANAIGANGQLRVTSTWASNNNANAKVGRIRFSGSGGNQALQITLTSSVDGWGDVIISNAGATNSQNCSGVSSISTNTSPFAATISAVDTTAATTIVHSLIHTTATDNVVLVAWHDILLSDGT